MKVQSTLRDALETHIVLEPDTLKTVSVKKEIEAV